MNFIKEFWEFLKVRKKYWLLPIIFVLVLFGKYLQLTALSTINSNILPFNFINLPQKC